MKTELPYIVIDTNVLISAGLLPQSKSAQVLALAVEHFVIAQNQETWHELETRIARSKFDPYFGDSGRLTSCQDCSINSAIWSVRFGFGQSRQI